MKNELTSNGKKPDFQFGAKQRAKYGAESTVVVCLFLAVVILLNVVVTTLGDKVTLKLDLTQSQILDFSDITLNTLKNLEKDVNVYSIIPESSGSEIAISLEEILSKYGRLSSHIKYKVIDANKNPGFMSKYVKDKSQLSSFSVLFECGDRFKIVDLTDDVSFASSDGQYLMLSNAEKKFTSAILYVLSDKDTKVAVLDGTHGEYIYRSDFPAYDLYSEVFKKENYDIEKVDIATQDIPKDADIVILGTPMTDYTEDEINKLEAFLKNGKTLQICFERDENNLPNLTSFLAEDWGIIKESGLLAEGDKTRFYTYPDYIIPTYEQNDITDSLISSRMSLSIVEPAALSINEKSNIKSEILARTTELAYLKTGTDINTYEYEKGDKRGEYVLSAILTDNNTNGRVQIFSGGSSLILAQDPSCANMDFYQNSVAFLSDKKEEISIRPKDVGSKTFMISTAKMIIMLAVFLVIIPLAVLILGLTVWLRRRHL